MGIIRSKFGNTAEGQKVSVITMVNKNGVGVELTEYGATLTALTVPDRAGRIEDVVLGYEDAMDYIRNTYFFGATIGRNGNRIGGAQVTLSNQTYRLDKNENNNNLHSGFAGYDKVVWDVEILEAEMTVKFSYHSPDGEQGFPGDFDITVAYTLTEENEIKIHYTGKSNADTIANLTNHSYFNLAGHGSGDVLEQVMWIDAEAMTVIDEQSIPTGELRAVKGTPMDFTTPKKIGRDIAADYEQLRLVKGYDHNYVLNNQNGQVRKVAQVTEEKSGRMMEVYTDCVGMQLYTGNFIGDGTIGKEGKIYGKHSGFCLETQFYPDANHHEHFPSSILKAGALYDTTTIYKFSIKE